MEAAKFQPGPTGWARYQEQGSDVSARVRFEVNDRGRLVIVELWLASHATGGRIDGAALRQIKVGQIEALANSSPYRDTLLKRWDEQPAMKAAMTRERPFAAPRKPVELRIDLPSGKPYPDKFFQAVASVYGYLEGSSRSPVKDMAELAGVPVERAHGWVKTARKRGFLGASRKGN